MNSNALNGHSPFTANGNTLGLGGGFGGGGGLGGGGGIGLASQAAQMGFHGVSTQQQTHGGIPEHGGRTAQHKGRIREVWKSNLHEEMEVIRNMVDKFPYVALDSAFPGLVARPMGTFHGKTDYHYQTLRCNVDFLQLMQLGISLFTAEGKTVVERQAISNDSAIDVNVPNALARKNAPCTWQFNFKFSLENDMYSQMAIDSKVAAGVDFAMLEKDGVDPHEFASLLISSGLVCDDDVRWISNHAGYDFGCLLKLLLCKPMPDEENSFHMLVKKFFPTHYDLKYLYRRAVGIHKSGALTSTNNDHQIAEVVQRLEQLWKTPAEGGGKLDLIADSMKIKRTGSAHLAGSDSLLSGKVFFFLRDKLLGGDLPENVSNKIWGLRTWDIFDENPPPYTPATSSMFSQPHAAQQFSQQQENATPGQNVAAYTNGAPSTPVAGNAALSITPAHASNGASMGPLTPGGGGGVFGNFQFHNKQ